MVLLDSPFAAKKDMTGTVVKRDGVNRRRSSTVASRSGKWPWRTSRLRPSSVVSSAYLLSKVATSASTACASSARAPLRNTSVSGSAKFPGWERWKTLVSVTSYHSFAGEVEALNTPTIRRLTPSCRHHLPPIAPHDEQKSLRC